MTLARIGNPAKLARLALAGAGALTLLLALSRVAYPHDLGQYEADVWAPADAIAHGHTPYHQSAATTPPYVVASYGPLYYAMVAIGVRLFGDQFAFGRTLGLVCVIASAACIYVILPSLAGDRSRLVPLLGAGLFLAQYPVQAVAGIEAPDMVGLALALGGLALVFSRGVSAEYAGPALAGLLLAAAVLVRQTMFLPVFIAAGGYAMRRERRAALVCGVVVVASTTYASTAASPVARRPADACPRDAYDGRRQEVRRGGWRSLSAVR